jgi:hypothetical protein
MRDIKRKPFHKRLRHAVSEALTAPLTVGSARRGRRAIGNPSLHMGKMPREFKQTGAPVTGSCFAPTRLPAPCKKLSSLSNLPRPWR